MTSAATRVAAVVGDPVRHSLSPILHNAAFRALDLDWVYVAFDVPTGSGAAALAAMRTLGIDGLSVTMPLKEELAGAVDRLSPAAARLRSVNCVHRVGDDLVGETTDGPGFLGALQHDEGFDPAGRRVVVLGAGGAARAVTLSLAEAGAGDVAVVNRSTERAQTVVDLLGDERVRCGSADDDIPSADLVVNATSVGMAGTPGEGRSPIDAGLLRRGQLLVDLVYSPLRTPLLEAGRSRGVTSVTGLGMLIHQAAHAFRLWTGEEPPLEVMSAAAVAALGHQDDAPNPN